MLSVAFATDQSFVEEVLPPPLEPADVPTARAMVGRWQSNCVSDFAGGAIYVSARHEGVDGEYVLAMFMDGDVPTIYGRDLFGEPKKIARTGLMRRGDAFRGWVERNGVRIIELQGQMSKDTGAFETEGYNFNFKARPAADGIGLEEDAVLTRARFEVIAATSMEGAGSAVLRGTVHDPLDEIPIRSVTGASYMECDLIGACEAVATTPADVFIPYHHGRQDDWSALDTESAGVVPVA
ncbi:MAG: acetoacetate decarboxylase family protein [Thermoleophilia bacterium]|nr:acetoacetate decarboxylase family protein [Thermoleophilia bacterium]